MARPLLHFTDRRNLKSILKHGLLSWEALESRNIQHFAASTPLSRTLDTRAGLGDYVRLCRSDRHPMAYKAKCDGRVGKLVWLKIDPGVVRWRSTRFSDINATSSNARVGGDADIFYDSSDLQAEVMIERALSTRWILNLDELS
jgi:hypothetical protein